MIREETPLDHEAVHALNEAAFGRSGEADLVDSLRSDGDVTLSLIAVEKAGLVGHVLFSKMTAPFLAWGLGPVAVAPNRQRTGIGSLLIRAGLGRARDAGIEGVIVLGAPGYYRRFGFDPTLAQGFASPYAGPYLMALALKGSCQPLRAT